MKYESPIPKDMPLEIAASKFAALGSEQRLSVLRALVRSGPSGISIGALGARTGVTGSTLTHHLRILTHAGLVRQEKQGRSIICAAAAYEEVQALSEFLVTQCCADCEGCSEHPEHHDG
ncbi:metalloregulator ArsR/SmtB family transcription factor [Salipiger sp. 1_MG-2023]|uniref:ArsR/SmtB family transcription factor n=1 Tax=Salipiger sp. 1_MG-2023 TaxID=3062665 RepID=UPI0026E21DBA|nr:metalloregulator ArsR/SmtB family transcription factor [Salipiger sp. 1_MG-2023]MDO6584201.1 metalloregulator ArsR/SmtB family transcription factor [Salipiger sp. 1_MG-2023]